MGVWEVCAGPNRSLLAWELSREWLTPTYCQLRLRLPAQMARAAEVAPNTPAITTTLEDIAGVRTPRASSSWAMAASDMGFQMPGAGSVAAGLVSALRH